MLPRRSLAPLRTSLAFVSGGSQAAGKRPERPSVVAFSESDEPTHESKQGVAEEKLQKEEKVQKAVLKAGRRSWVNAEEESEEEKEDDEAS